MLLLIRALSLVGVPILISPSILISDPVLLSPPILIFYNIRVRVCINRGSFSFNCSQTVMPHYETRILSTRSSNRTSKKAHWESFYLRYWCKWHCQRYRRRNRSKFPHVNWTEHSSYICYCYSVCCCSAMDSGFRIPDSSHTIPDSLSVELQALVGFPGFLELYSRPQRPGLLIPQANLLKFRIPQAKIFWFQNLDSFT